METPSHLKLIQHMINHYHRQEQDLNKSIINSQGLKLKLQGKIECLKELFEALQETPEEGDEEDVPSTETSPGTGEEESETCEPPGD